MTLLNLSLTLCVFSALSLAAIALLTRTARAAARRVFQATRQTTHSPSIRNHIGYIKLRITQYVTITRTKLNLTGTDDLKDRLALAGFRTPNNVDNYFATKLLLPLAGLALGALIPTSRIFFMLLIGAIAYLATDFYLKKRTKNRREKLRRSLPDALDLLVICVDAGLGLDQAILRVADELHLSHPEIHEEFLQINREQRAGKLRMEAWQAMSARCQVPEVEAFVNMLLQTDRFGTPIARALREFADGLRQKRRLRAEELAAKTTVKIIFPLVLFIFPSMFIVLLGPAALNIIHGFASS